MKKISTLHGSTIENALQYLKEQSKIQNEDLYANFNDKEIFSTDSIDDAYKRIVGKTKEEFDADFNKWREEYDRREQEHKDNIPNLTEEYRQKARGLVIESELEYWDEIVPIRLDDIYRGMELQQVIDCAIAMKNTTMTKEERLRRAYKIFMDAGHSGMSASLTMAMLRRFCPNGNELADACNEFRFG